MSGLRAHLQGFDPGLPGVFAGPPTLGRCLDLESPVTLGDLGLGVQAQRRRRARQRQATVGEGPVLFRSGTRRPQFQARHRQLGLHLELPAQVLPAAAPAGREGSGAPDRGFRQIGGHAGPARDPAGGFGGIVELKVQRAFAPGFTEAAGQRGGAAGQAQAEPGVPGAAVGVEGHAALQLRIVGLCQQRGQGQVAVVPAALGLKPVQAQAAHPRRSRAGGGLHAVKVGLEDPGLPLKSGRQRAVEHGCGQARVGCGRIDSAEAGASVPGRCGGVGAWGRVRVRVRGRSIDLALCLDLSTCGGGVQRFDDPLAGGIAGAGVQA